MRSAYALLAFSMQLFTCHLWTGYGTTLQNNNHTKESKVIEAENLMTLKSHNISHLEDYYKSSTAINNLTSTLKPNKVQPKPTSKPNSGRKSGRTDSPILSYIFDSRSALNKHHHHDYRFGPRFEDADSTGIAANMTVQLGSTANLNCRISLLRDKTVSWVRRRHGEDDLQLLTVGMHTYSGDSRYTVEFQYPNNWRLQIKLASKIDEGQYECQISTHPPKVIQINLHISAPEIMIVDEHEDPLFEKYYEVNSTIQLQCVVRHIVMTSSVVLWLHDEHVLNYDIIRGGISVKTDLMEEGANSTLFVARVDKGDSGNYTCSISPTQYYTIAVHVLNEESLAELHHSKGNDVTPVLPVYVMTLIIIILITS